MEIVFGVSLTALSVGVYAVSRGSLCDLNMWKSSSTCVAMPASLAKMSKPNFRAATCDRRCGTTEPLILWFQGDSLTLARILGIAQGPWTSRKVKEPA